MSTAIDYDAINAAFSQPDNDGTFPEQFGKYLGLLGGRRPSVILAFPPKAAGTFLRTASIMAVNGQLVRVVHAQGGRDAQPYLPLFLRYYLGLMGEQPLVTHVHMQALPANCRFVEALGLRPVVMIRAIPDMLASYRDMLDTDDAAMQDGLNCTIPANFRGLTESAKADFLVDVLGPWYAGYYATWMDYAQTHSGRVCVLRYEEFRRAPEGVLETILAHAGLPRPLDHCRDAIASAWLRRSQLRFNRGQSARGRSYFSDSHRADLSKLLGYYPSLASVRDELV